MTSLPKPAVEYCIFDLDGLLVDTETINTQIETEMLQSHGFQFTYQVKLGQMGKPFAASIGHIFTSFPGLAEKITPAEYMAQRQAMQAERFRSVGAMRGAVRLVQHLHKHGIPIAIASGTSNEGVTNKTAHLQDLITPFPPHCIITSESPEVPKGRVKPCPDVFLAAGRALGRNVGHQEEGTEEQRRERGKGLVFEDAVLGAQAGVRAGMHVVLVSDAQLKALYPGEMHGSAALYESLEEFRPEEWGLPGYDDEEKEVVG